ncbi:unnamed protein product [Rhizophagus irregularis]|nr:unnamed protein product [Rhizophagus irregularis]
MESHAGLYRLLPSFFFVGSSNFYGCSVTGSEPLLDAIRTASGPSLNAISDRFSSSGRGFSSSGHGFSSSRYGFCISGLRMY